MDKEAKDKRPLAEYLEKAWGHALMAVSTAEEEAGKLVQKLASAAGWTQDEVKRQGRDLTERLQGQRKDLEKTVEDGVKRVVETLRVPRRDEMQDMARRLDALSERLDRLKGG